MWRFHRTRHVVSGGYDGILRLWDVSTGEEIRRFEGHARKHVSVAYSPEGRRILSAGADRSVQLWDAETGKELSRFTSPKAFNEAAFSPDGRMALAAGTENGAILYRLPDLVAKPEGQVKAEPPILQPLHRIRSPEGKSCNVGLSPDNRYFARVEGTLGVSTYGI